MKYISVGVEHGYIQYIILRVFRLIGGGLFHTPYWKLFIRVNCWIISLTVISIIHSTVSQVFLCLVIFIISYFYQLINFLDTFRHLTKYIRASWTYTQLLVSGVFLDRSWHVRESKLHYCTYLYTFTCLIFVPQDIINLSQHR